MGRGLLLLMALSLLSTGATGVEGADGRADPDRPKPRARELGLEFGVLPTGPHNAITDVSGVRVGHFTLQRGNRFNTGITAVLPHGGNVFHERVPAAVVVGNGFGKLLGSTQVNELGELETPILLTGTLNVPKVADGLISYMLSLPGMEEVRSINPVVGETNDGYLSDIRARPLGAPEVRQAIASAGDGPVVMGTVGAGTGTVCFDFKGGIGSASRRLDEDKGGWTVGVLVQTNFGGSVDDQRLALLDRRKAAGGVSRRAHFVDGGDAQSRRLADDRHCHRCTSDPPQPAAAGTAEPLWHGPHRWLRE